MTAQYRPYRDEDCVDSAEAEHIGWSDHEPGIQIYEKTTEAMPFARQRRSYVLVLSLSVFLAVVFGFLLGFFSHSTHAKCITNTAAALDSVRENDPTIRQKLLSRIDAAEIRRVVRDFSAKPHMAASEEDYQLAMQISRTFQSLRFDKTLVKNYSVLLSLPDKSTPNFVSIVDEGSNQEIFNSQNLSQTDDSFCLYSPKGDITGDVMFINYGRPVDYLQAQELFNTSENIFKNKILLAKQFHISASEQYKYAMLMNASALLLYPDPQHYNPRNEAPFPDSLWLPPDGVRSDSIFWNGAGDPETFGVSSNEYAYRDSVEFVHQTSMLAQPISYKTAFEIIKRLQGKDAPFDWKGGFNLTYKIGPGFGGNLKVRVQVNNKLLNRNVTNVIGTIRGSVEPDRYVIVGNQRDSLSTGAIDSASGTAVFLELARVFGSLLKEGWKPRRSITFASWGAEEFNLIGSTEWVEEMNKMLYMRAVAYININLLVTGRDTLSVTASPLLHHAIFNASKEVILPESDTHSEEISSVYDRWITAQRVMRNQSNLVFNLTQLKHLNMLNTNFEIKEFTADELHHFHREEASEPGTILKTYLQSASQEIRPYIRPLNMYSSYAPFVTIAGVPSLELAFVHQSAEEYYTESDEFEKIAFSRVPYPLLHTKYDQLKAVERFVDPNFTYHKLACQVLAELTRDLSDSLFLPFNVLDYAQLLKDFYSKSILLHNIIQKDFTTNEGDHSNLELMYHLDMQSLEWAIYNFTNEAIRFHANQDRMDLKDPMAIRRINDQLLLVERQFLDHRGIPGNNLKKHLILSPAETLSSINALETEGLFPALLDEMDQIIGNVFKKDIHSSLLRLQKHLPVLINSIQSATDSLVLV